MTNVCRCATRIPPQVVDRYDQHVQRILNGESVWVLSKCGGCNGTGVAHSGNEDRARQVEYGVTNILAGLGQDVTREGLKATPARVAKMLRELCHQEPFEFTTFESEGVDSMIVQSNIPMHSLCEHHMLPFMGTATVAYIPNKGRIVGLSKLARTVKFCSAGLQNQERITRAVADMLVKNLDPAGVGVVIRARHLCMELRGVEAANVYTTTSDLRGVILSDASARAEFLSLAKGS